jgi:predicted nucleic acid-binding protein
MKPVFADTAFYLALINPQDQWHHVALDLSESLLGRMFVTEYVLVELGSAMSRGSDRAAYLAVLEEIEADESTVIIPASMTLFRQGVALFKSRPDKNWSLVDCISFVVMKQRRLTEALTADHHCEQAGFKVLLK